MIYHIALAEDWERATWVGEYRVSTLGQMLDEVGFIHCGTGEQVALVANSIYRGRRDLVLLTIVPDRVQPEIRYEDMEGREPTSRTFTALFTSMRSWLLAR